MVAVYGIRAGAWAYSALPGRRMAPVVQEPQVKDVAKTEEHPHVIQQLPVSESEPRFVSFRAMAIACALMPLLAMWVVQSELIWYTGHSTAISLFFHVTFTIFVIGLVNLAIERKFPRLALSPGEILTIYVMLSVAGTLCSHDLLQVMIPSLAFPKMNANPQNRWEELILSHIPSWAIVTDFKAYTGLAVGNSYMYTPGILLAWAKPLAFWSFFLCGLMGGILFLNVFFRQAWTEKERLAFPVIQIPLIIAGELRDLLKNKLFWLAFTIAGSIDMINNISFLNPNVPSIPIVRAFMFRDYFVEKPWSAIATTEMNFYPFVIGLAFFLPTDLAFSCWFFFLFFKVEVLLSAAIGFRDLPEFPYPSEQSGGAYIAVGLFAIWLARRHLAGVGRTILGRPNGADESGEPIRYRTALIGFIVCLSILVSCGTALGASSGVMLVFFLIYFIYGIAIARMRAELGPPAHDLHDMGPDQILHNLAGTRALGPTNLTTFSLFYWFNRAYRAHLSAHSMEAFKIAQLQKIRSRSMMKAIVIALVVGLFSAYWALLHSLYTHGYSGKPAGDAFAQQAWGRVENWLAFPKQPRVAASAASAIAMCFTFFLGVMRTRYTWWVWHPVGYATSMTWSMERLWTCVLIAWVAKLLITRYGGATAYRKAIPFFVGLVLGEFTVGSLWCIWGAFMSTRVYHFWG